MQADQFQGKRSDGADPERALIDQLIAATRLYCSSEAIKELFAFTTRLREFAPFNAMLLHIQKPGLTHAATAQDWNKRFSDEERLDVFNGLLLSALWDAAFDKFLVTFRENGCPEFSSRLSAQARSRLENEIEAPIRLSEAHLPYLMHHRAAFSGLSFAEASAARG